VRAVEVFLGKVGYYHKFVKNFSKVALPLNKLKRKGTEWRWGKVEQEAFENLRDQLCELPILRHPDFKLPFILQTDASGYGLGAVLSQEFEDGEHPIVYASRSLEDREMHYEVIEKEALAIAWGIHQFRHYLLGKPFRVQTDHKPLVALHRIKDQNIRLQKISIKLQGYQYQIEYKPGIKNQNADLLSRYPVMPQIPNSTPAKGGWTKEKTDLVDRSAQKIQQCLVMTRSQSRAAKQDKRHLPVFPTNLQSEASEEDSSSDDRPPSPPIAPNPAAPPGSPSFALAAWDTIRPSFALAAWDTIREDLLADRYFGPLLRYHRDGVLPDQLGEARRVLASHDLYLTDDSLLYRITNHRIQLCIPQPLREPVMFQCHNVPASGHLGMKKTYQKLVQRFYWPQVHYDLEKYIRTCPECLMHKAPPRNPREKLGFRPPPLKVWETVHMDIWSPGVGSRSTRKGNVCVLALVDAFSKYVVAYPLPNHTAGTVADTLVNAAFAAYGPPTRIIQNLRGICSPRCLRP
jgi:hypothetical protein